MIEIMLRTVFILALVGHISCTIPELLKADFFNIYRHAAIETRDIQDKPVDPSNVTYYLYTIDNPKNYIQLDPKNLANLANRKSKIVFFIHGWVNDRDVQWYEDLKNAFLATYKGNYSVVEVDWKEPANQFYYVSSINTYDVAKFIAEVIVDLNQNYKVKLDDILLVGHSLGGQITGFVGKHVYKMTGNKLHRIVALDPAGPLFDTRPEDKRLNKNDAEIVEAIHTDGGTFGFKDVCGTIDFFVNGGSSQPGCKRIDLLDIISVSELVICDHMRAPDYFVEAVLNPGELLAKKCEHWGLFGANNCEDVEVALGDLTTTLTGKFYLETNKDKPYSKKGVSGIGGKILSVLPSTGETEVEKKLKELI